MKLPFTCARFLVNSLLFGASVAIDREERPFILHLRRTLKSSIDLELLLTSYITW